MIDRDALIAAYEGAGLTQTDLATDMKREMALMMIDWDVVEQLYEAAQRAGTCPASSRWSWSRSRSCTRPASWPSARTICRPEPACSVDRARRTSGKAVGFVGIRNRNPYGSST
jgi:hypothetical protein